MSLLSSGLFHESDLVSMIKYSNYNVYYNSERNYEQNYYALISYLHEFCEKELEYGNNGIWKLKVREIELFTFNKFFIAAWGNRSNNFSDNISIDYINRAVKYIHKFGQVSLSCKYSIEYIIAFIKEVFNNYNPWLTLIYFSKFVSTFLPDLAIPFDTRSLSKIAREFGISGETKELTDYVAIHKFIKEDLIRYINRNSLNVVNFKELDNPISVGKSPLFILEQTPLNRPIDKIYYTV